MEYPSALPHFQHRTLGTLAIARGPLSLRFARNALHGLAGNAVVDDIDHTPHGATAVLQGGRSAQHFNALGGQHIRRHCMVITERRNIHAGATVVEHTNAITVKTANDGPAGIGSKVSAADTWQLIQGFTQGTLPLLQQ